MGERGIGHGTPCCHVSFRPQGRDCEVALDGCSQNPCANGGTCQPQDGDRDGFRSAVCGHAWNLGTGAAASHGDLGSSSPGTFARALTTGGTENQHRMQPCPHATLATLNIQAFLGSGVQLAAGNNDGAVGGGGLHILLH